MSEHHVGLRRRQSRLPVGRLLVLAVALAAIIRLLTLSDPGREPAPAGTPFAAAVPTWSGPASVDVAGVLADGATYTPRLFLTADTSVGVATSSDGTVRVVLDQARGQATELRRLSPADHPQVNGFAFADDTLVWMESVSRPASGAVTTLWRTAWRTAARPVLVTTNTGQPMFYGVQSDVLVRDGRVYWTAVGPGNPAATELRSVAVTGGTVTTKRIPGEYLLSTWPWMVSVTGGRGAPVTMLDATTDATVTVTTGSTDIPVCAPTWCRMAVAGGEGLAGIDVMRPDGSQRRRIANSEATPTIADATLLDRYVPLATDRGSGGGVGLSLYDLSTGHTDLVAVGVANIQGRDGILWWSTGAGPQLVWHAVDLHVLG